MNAAPKVILMCLYLAASLTNAHDANADTLSKEDYKTATAQIEAELKTAKRRCDGFSGNVKDICLSEANGVNRVARAYLQHMNVPSSENRYALAMAKAESAYTIAREQCDDISGNAKDICIKMAKSAKVSATENAKVQRSMSNISTDATQAVTEVRSNEGRKIAEVRKDAKENKMAADYAVALEVCDTLSGAYKDKCISDAKITHGKQ